MTVTDEYGATSTLTSGSNLPITGQVQYLSVPQGSLTIAAQESYGTNLALRSSAGGSATATQSTSATCNGSAIDPAIVLEGVDDSQGNNYGQNCDGRDGQDMWWSVDADSNPYLTINLGSAKANVDRIFVSSSGLGSSRTSLKDYTVSTNPSCSGGSFTNTQITDQFFDRNNLVNITPTTVCQIKLSNFTINYTGSAGGLQSTWWPCCAVDDISPVYDVEAFAQGSAGSGTAPSVSVSSPAASANVHATTTITSSAIDNSGSGLQKVEFYVDGTL
jgi:hypothetical protein